MEVLGLRRGRSPGTSPSGGSSRAHGLILCTDSYTIQEVILLMNVLMIKYQLDCTLREHRANQYRIYIREGSMERLRAIVLPHMDYSMLYKLGL